MREFFKTLGVFFLFVTLIGVSLFTGYSVGKTEHSRALEGCEVVVSQAVKDNKAQAEEYYKDLTDLQDKMKACDEFFDNLQNLDLSVE